MSIRSRASRIGTFPFQAGNRSLFGNADIVFRLDLIAALIAPLAARKCLPCRRLFTAAEAAFGLILANAANQGQEAVNRGHRIRFLECAVLPLLDVLMLDRHAGGDSVMNRSSLPKIRPSTFRRRLGPCLPWNVSSLWRIARSFGEGFIILGRSGRFLADVGHAIKSGLGIAADAKIHRAVLGIDDQIGKRHSRTAEKWLDRGLVRAALAA